MTLPHVGIIVTVLGTVLMAFSLKIIKQYSFEVRTDKDKISPTQTEINKWLFWTGLFCIAMGSFFQW